VPLAATEKVAVAGAVTVWLTGCVVIVGPICTVSVAGFDVTEPWALLTVTSYLVPLCATVVVGVVYEADVAPLIAVNDEAPDASLDH